MERRHRLEAEIRRVCLEMTRAGINQGTSGNVSARWEEGFLITPSGRDYESLKPGDLVVVDGAGRWADGQTPSSEWRLHQAIYDARPDAGAVVHAHPPYATALACLGEGIPSFHYMVAAAGGADIRCAPYHTFGTEALAEGVLEALEGRRACLMANHGMVAFGADLAGALWLAVEVETLARQYLIARQAGTPRMLNPAEMARVLEKFRSYGPAGR